MMTSYEVGYRLMERDRKRAQFLFRTQSLKQSLDVPPSAGDGDDDATLGNFEPDWSKFECVYASGEYMLSC